MSDQPQLEAEIIESPEALASEPAEAPEDWAARLERCQDVLNYRFRDLGLLTAALTHASSASHRLASNERLEFLGDSILGMIVCERLYQDYPEYLEGDLTRVKSVVVSRETCANISRRLGLAEFMILGKGMGGDLSLPPSLLADVWESLLAAIYLDGGFEAARQFATPHVLPEIVRSADSRLNENYKSLLQQIAQRNYSAAPHYHLLGERGPDHKKAFKVAAQIGAKRFPAAWGRNKKEAEQRAASNALCAIRGEPAPFACDEESS